MNNDNEFVIYFIATRPDPVKAVGDRMYFDEAEAQDAAVHLRVILNGPWRVYQAIVTKIEATR